MNPALPSSLPSDPVSGTHSSTAFLVLLGAVSAGLPQLILPTATIAEFIGNSLMGALVTGIVDVFLLRRTLPPEQLKKGRMLALIFISAALTIVTYRSPDRCFQDVFDTAPPRDNTLTSLTARARTLSRPGQIAYRLYFFAEPIAVNKLEESLSKVPTTRFDPTAGSWPAYLERNLPAESPLRALAEKFQVPQSILWTSERPRGTTTTLLLRDRASGLTLVEHLPG